MEAARKLIRPVLAAAAVALAAAALAACGEEEHLHVEEGQTVAVDELSYNVVFSRLLNINDVEDRAYLTGHDPPPPGSSYLGVFVQIESEAEEGSRPIPDGVHVVDTEGREFEPLESESVYALDFDAEIGPGEEVPAPDSPAQTGPTTGSLILFEITDEAAENRPLELVIPGDEDDGRVELDI